VVVSSLMKEIKEAQMLNWNQLESFVLRGALLVNLKQSVQLMMGLMKYSHPSPSV
jgi:hypothetical protein